MKNHSSKFIALLAGMAAISPAANAQNENYDTGDLVLFFQKPGNENTVYVGLGNAANSYRGSAAGADANRQALNIVNIASELTTAFGAGWASDPDIFAGLAACWSASPNTTAHLNGDPHRTLYTSQPRSPLGTPGSRSSEPWDFALAGFSGPSTNMLAMNNKLETEYTTRAAVSPVSDSTIDDQNPIETTPGGQFLQPSAFGSFPGGVQQQGTATTLGAFGPAGQVEFALDLYRILPRTGVTGQVDGPDKLGSFEGTVVVASSGAVSFITQVSVPAPEIDLEQSGGASVADGQNVGFTNTIVGETSTEKTFIIRNNGDADLTGISLSLTGDHDADFNVSGPAETSLAAGASTSFTVSFSPQAAGARSATLQIASNDADENPYDIPLTGPGIAASPEISVLDPAAVDLVDGTAKASLGSVAVGFSSKSQTFTIRNVGNATLSGLTIAKSGANAADFSVSALTKTSLAANGSTTFKVVFTPNAVGTRTASIQIGSNDANENPFDIQLSGKAITPVPEIDIQQKAGSSLADGKSKISFGTVPVGRTGTAKTFTIRNTGSANLTGISVSNSGGNSKDFLITKPAKTTVAPGSSVTFKVSLKPSAKGALSTTMRVKSNDASENPFDIVLTGLGAK